VIKYITIAYKHKIRSLKIGNTDGIMAVTGRETSVITRINIIMAGEEAVFGLRKRET
jgi:hypothetical protein